MAEDYGTLWYVLSFWAVGIAQQPLLVGVSLPLCSVHIRTKESPIFSDANMVYANYALFALCVSAILTAESADTSLQKFMVENKVRVQKGQNKIPILREGLWKYSRHPNYFGNSLMWWGIYLVCCNAKNGWKTIYSPVLMTYLLTNVSGAKLLERTLKRTKPGFAEYVKSVPEFVPWKLLRSKFSLLS